MTGPKLSPRGQFLQFEHALRAFRQFEVREVTPSGFRIWERGGWHDKLSKTLRDNPCALVVRRRFDGERGVQPMLALQVGLIEWMPNRPSACVYVRAREFEKGLARNEAHLTFKFRWDDRLGGYLEVRRKRVLESLERLRKSGSLPWWLRPCRIQGGRIGLGTRIDSALIQRLFLLADFVGQAMHGGMTARNLRTFLPPLENKPKP
jgi:hypothetical protein